MAQEMGFKGNEVKQCTRLFIVIFILGVFCRILWLSLDPHEIVSDEVDYHNLAISLAQGNGYGIPFWPPGYPIVLSILYVLFGSSPRIAIGFNLILSLATLISTAWVAKRLFGDRIAIISFLLMSLMPSYILTISLVRYEVLLQFSLILSFLLSLYRWRWINMVCIALLTALATLIRPLMIFWPIMLWLVKLNQQSFNQQSLKHELYKLGVIQALSVLLITPWIVYASITTGRFVPIALNGGMNLWIGNNPNATGAYMSPPGEFWNPANEAIASREAIDYILNHPTHVLRLLPKKIAYSFVRENWPVDLIFLKTSSVAPSVSYEFLSAISNAYYAVVVGMAIASIMIFLWKKRYRQLLPLLLMVYSIFGQLPFFGSPRFRWITQFILIFYAASLPTCLGWVRSHIQNRILKSKSETKMSS